MCGIWVASQLTPPTQRMAPFLSFAMQFRGDDSWGSTDGNEIIKNVGPITESWVLPESWTQAVIHTRAATVGDITVENSHPFQFGNVIGVHNGMVRNHDILDRENSRNFSVDSMHIFAHIAENKNLQDIRGYGTVVYYQDGQLFFVTFGTGWSWYIARLISGEIVGCSSKSAIEAASNLTGAKIDQWYEVKHNIKYRIATDEVYNVGEMKFGSDYETFPFGKWNRPTVYHASGGSIVKDRNNSPSPKWCYDCKRVEINRENRLYCEECYQENVARAKIKIASDEVVELLRVDTPVTTTHPYSWTPGGRGNA
jgi:hypothetical protein